MTKLYLKKKKSERLPSMAVRFWLDHKCFECTHFLVIHFSRCLNCSMVYFQLKLYQFEMFALIFTAIMVSILRTKYPEVNLCVPITKIIHVLCLFLIVIICSIFQNSIWGFASLFQFASPFYQFNFTNSILSIRFF